MSGAGRSARLAAAVLLLPAAGCVSAPPRRQPAPELVEAPGAWTASAPAETPPAAAPAPLDAWWRGFADPRLDGLIEQALNDNEDLAAAAARVQQAEAVARIAGADLRPQVGVRLDATRQRQNFVGFPIPGDGVPSATFSRFGVSVDVAWEADLWGRLRAGARAALADLQAQAADLRGARLSVAGQLAKAYFAAQEASLQVVLAERTAASRAVSAAQIETRYRQGLRPPVDLRLALSTRADAEVAVALARQRLDLATRQIEILLGGYPRGDIGGVLGTASLPPTPPPPPAGIPAEILTRRPDLVAAERRLAAAGQRVAEARRALYPRLSLTASGGTASDQLGDLLDGDFRVWSLLGGLLQPVFQGGRLRAAVDRARGAEAEGLARYADAVLVAFAEVEGALAAEAFLAEQERAAAESARHLAAARELADLRYRNGVGDYLTVLESQTREFRAEAALLALRRQRLANRVDLFLALGGGFQPEPGEAAGAPEQHAGGLPGEPRKEEGGR